MDLQPLRKFADTTNLQPTHFTDRRCTQNVLTMFLSCSYRWEGLAGSAPSLSQVWKMLQSANQAKRFAACCTAGRSQVFFIASITCVVSILAAALFSSFSRSQRPQGCNKGFKVGLVSWLALLVAQWSSIPSLDPSPKTALPPLSQVPVCISPYLPTSCKSYHEAQ